MRDIVKPYWQLTGVAWRASRSLFVYAVALEGLFGLSAPLGAAAVGLLVDGVIGGDRGQWITATVVLGLAPSGMWIGGGLGGRLRMTLTDKVGFSLERTLVEASLAVPGVDHYQDPDLADQLFLVRDRVGQAGQAINMLVNAIAATLRTVATVALLAAADPLWVLAVAAATPMTYATVRSSRLAHEAELEAARPRRLARSLTDAVLAPDAAALVRSRGAADHVRRRVSDLMGKDFRIRRRAALLGAAWQVSALVVFGGAFVGLAAWTVASRDLSPGELVMVALLGTQLSGFLQGLNQAWGGARASVWPVIHLQSLVDALEERSSRRRGPDRQTVSAAENGVAFQLDGVTHRYGSTDALVDVSLSVEKGEVLGVVGENGAGKTTFVNLLLGLLEPTEGRVHRSCDHGDAALLQDFARPELVMRDVIGFGAPAEPWTDHEVYTAVSRAGLNSLVDRFDGGLSAEIGASWGGAEPSGGQWQLLAFGRSSVREEPDLLVLDEPTAAIAPDQEHQMLKALEQSIERIRSRRECAGVVVSHRLGLMKVVDHIVVLEAGRVVEEGSHSDLMARPAGRYRQLFELQAEGYR